MGVVPGIAPLEHPTRSGLKRCRFTLLGDLGVQPSLLQTLAGDVGVVGAIQRWMLACDRAESPPTDSLKRAPGWGLKAATSRGGWRGLSDAPYGDALRIYRCRAFDALFSPIHRAFARLLAAARGLLGVMQPSTGLCRPVGGRWSARRPPERHLPQLLHTPRSIHSSRRGRRVVSEHNPSAILW